ncbi:MAG: PAS domain-containing protein [Myxococcota bacterium]
MSPQPQPKIDLRRVLDAIPGTAAIIGADGVILAVNRAWERFGEENGARRNFVGENYLQVSEDDTAETLEVRRGILDVLAGTRELFAIEAYPCHSPTQPRWFSMFVTPMRGVGALVLHFNVTSTQLANGVDISDSVRFRRLFDSATIGVARTSMKHGFIEVNDAFCRMVGYDREEILGKPLGYFQHPDQKNANAEIRERIFKGEAPGITIERCILTKSGGLRWVEMSLDLRRRDDGEPYEALVLVRDVTERHQRAAEHALSEERLALILRSTQDAFWDLDLETGAVWWNDRARELVGLPEDAPPTTVEGWLSIVHAEDRARVRLAQSAVTTDDRWLSEHRIQRRDGKVIEVLERGTIIRALDGQPRRIIGSTIDVTARRAQERDLAAREARSSRAIRGTMDGMWDWNMDTGEAYFSPRLYELLGYTEGELTASEDAFFKLIHREDLDRCWAALHAHLDGKAPYDVVIRLRHKDGSWRWFRSRGEIFRGSPSSMSGFLSDVDEQHRASEEIKALTADLELRVAERTEALRQSQERLTLATRAGNIGVWQVDLGRGQVEMDETMCAHYGRPAPQWRGPIADCVAMAHTLDRPRIHQIAQDAIAKGDVVDIDYRVVWPTGEIHHVHAHGRVTRDPSGQAKEVQGVSWDLTELRRRDDALYELNLKLQNKAGELERVNKDLESFAYSVSHDLRAPLRAIDGFSRILGEAHAQKLDGEGLELLTEVRSNAQRMGHLVDDLLSFSRLGRSGVKKSAVDTQGLVEECLRELGVNKGGSVELSIGPLPEVYADAPLLKQVWLNLLENALKYSKNSKPPRIEISAREEPKETIFVVKDNGVGFDMRYVDQLFQVFHRLHTDPQFSGTGVGLAIVHRIIERHGGRIWADARPDHGATFTFALPRAPSEVSS